MIGLTEEMINIKGGKYETTALMKAAREGHVKIVELLLDVGADVDVRSSRYGEGGWQAIHFATFYGHLDVAKLIAKNHPEVLKAKTDRGATPLSLAINWNQYHIVNWITKEKGVRDDKSSCVLQ